MEIPRVLLKQNAQRTCHNFCYNKYEIYKYWTHLLLSQQPDVSEIITAAWLWGVWGALDVSDFDYFFKDPTK